MSTLERFEESFEKSREHQGHSHCSAKQPENLKRTLERLLKRLIRMGGYTSQSRISHLSQRWVPVAAALLLGFFPTGIRAFDPFTLYSQARVPEKPQITTRIEPGDHSRAAKHSCKDPSHTKLRLRRHSHSPEIHESQER
jgi:hypothetical protein